MQSPRVHDGVYIYYNILENIGWGDGAWGFGISIGQGAADAETRNIYILNNVIQAGATGTARGGIYMNSSYLLEDVFIRNNIIVNMVAYGCIIFWDGAGTIDKITITNNILYNNVNSNDFYYRNGKSVTNLVNSDDIEDNPDFVSTSDFHLQAGSPAINAGLATGQAFITTDYDDVAISNPPEIGAYEF